MVALEQLLGFQLSNIFSQMGKHSLRQLIHIFELMNEFLDRFTFQIFAACLAPNIDESETLRGELTRLSGSFGIGVIEQALDDPEKSQILCQAKRKSEIDWKVRIS